MTSVTLPIPTSAAALEEDLAMYSAAIEAAYKVKGLAARDLKTARSIFAEARDHLATLERHHDRLEAALADAELAEARAFIHPAIAA